MEENRGLDTSYRGYRPNHTSGWYHCIVRLPDGVFLERDSEQVVKLLEDFNRIKNSDRPIYIVIHKDDVCSHVHFQWFHYKNSTKTQWIWAWKRWLGSEARLWVKSVADPVLLGEYLLQGNGREVVYQNDGRGWTPGEQAIRETNLQWREEVKHICEPGSWGCEVAGDIRKAKGVKRTAGERHAGGLYSRGEEAELAKQLKKYVYRYIGRDINTIYNNIIISNDDEAKAWWTSASVGPTFMTTFKTIFGQVKLQYKAEGYLRQAERLSDEPLDNNCLDMQQSYSLLHNILTFNGIDPLEFVKTAVNVMCMTSEKKNCLYLIGEPNCGKTTIEMALSEAFQFKCSITNLTENSNSFAFDSLPYAGVVCMNEPFIGQRHVETCKLMFEGNNFECDIKYGDKVWVTRLPVIVTTNRHIWVYARYAEPAIRERIFEYKFTVPIGRSKRIHPKVFYNIAKHYGFLPVESRVCTSSPPRISVEDFGQFQPVPQHAPRVFPIFSRSTSKSSATSVDSVNKKPRIVECSGQEPASEVEVVPCSDESLPFVIQSVVGGQPVS